MLLSVANFNEALRVPQVCNLERMPAVTTLAGCLRLGPHAWLDPLLCRTVCAIHCCPPPAPQSFTAGRGLDLTAASMLPLG